MEDTTTIKEKESQNINSGPEEIKLDFPTLSEYVSVIRLFVSGVSARMDLPVDVIDDIKVAVSEACTNVIQHAYNGTPGRVYLTCNVHPDKLELVVEDFGQGFDMKTVKSAEERAEGELDETMGLGLGLTFIKTLMDESEISSKKGKGTIIKMVKYKPSSTNE